MLHESSEISTAIDFRNTHKVMKIALNIALVQFRSDTEFTATVFRVRTAVNACNLPVLEVSLFLYCFTYICIHTCFIQYTIKSDIYGMHDNLVK